MKTRKKNIEDKTDFRKWFNGELQKYCGMRRRKPQRMITLPKGEEAIRCKLTWQMLDRIIYHVAFGGLAYLQTVVVDAEFFFQELEEMCYWL